MVEVECAGVVCDIYIYIYIYIYNIVLVCRYSVITDTGVDLMFIGPCIILIVE